MGVEDLVRRAVGGDKSAFSDLVRRYQKMVFTYALSKLKDVEEARDAAQETFIRAYESISSLRDPSKFLPWLREIASNVCAMWRRKERARESLDEEGASEEGKRVPEELVIPSFEREMEVRELKQEVLNAILSLPEKYRHVLLLHYFDELPQKEVADFMGLSSTAVATRIGRAKEMLRRKLGQLPEEGDRIRKIQIAIVERPISERAKISPDDVVLIHYDLGVPDSIGWSPIRIHGTEGDELWVEGRKTLIGESEDEALEEDKRLKLFVGRRSGVFEEGPFDGDIPLEIEHNGDVSHVSLKRWWDDLKRDIYRDKVLFEAFKDLLEGEVLVIGVRGGGMKLVRIDERVASRRFINWWAIDSEGEVLCPAGSFELDIHIPRCRAVLFTGFGRFEAKGLKADLGVFTTRYPVLFSAEGIEGRVLSYGTFPSVLKGIGGDVNICYPFCGFPKGRWEERVISRNRDFLRMRISDVRGSVRVRCEGLDLKLEGIWGDVDVENLFGNTELYVTGLERSIKLESVSGDLMVYLPEGGEISIAAWASWGFIDYREYEGEVCGYRDLRELYVGTYPKDRAEEALMKLKVRSGGITIRTLKEG